MKFIYSLVVLWPLTSFGYEPNEYDLVFSSSTLNSFSVASECLVLRAPESVKRDFLTSRMMGMEWDVSAGGVMGDDWMKAYIDAEDSDRVEVFSAIKKYCPDEASAMLSNMARDGVSDSQIPSASLFELVVKFVSIDVLDAGERRRLYNAEQEKI